MANFAVPKQPAVNQLSKKEAMRLADYRKLDMQFN